MGSISHSRFDEDWLRYSWDLVSSRAPKFPPSPTAPFRLSTADADNRLLELLGKAVAMDSSLGEAGRRLRDFFLGGAVQEWRGLDIEAVGVFHGGRIIGASVLSLSGGPRENLLSGPCVLFEYRNRGLGTLLLHASLWRLKTAGEQAASGLSRPHSALAKYLYPKFGGTAAGPAALCQEVAIPG